MRSVNTYFNETAFVSGIATAGLTWEIDEPGFAGMLGDIYPNFTAGDPDDTNAFGGGAIDDVAMAMGFNVILAANETATVTWRVSEVAPTSGFYLVQTDPDSQASVYFSSGVVIREGDEPPIPEPGTLTLLGLGLAMAARRLRRRG